MTLDDCRDLYQFWGGRLVRRPSLETDFVLNPASQEYLRAVKPHLPQSVQFLTCTFGERKGGKIIKKGTMCKMARGQMVRRLAENNVTNAADIQFFDQLDYRFRPDLPAARSLVAAMPQVSCSRCRRAYSP